MRRAARRQRGNGIGVVAVAATLLLAPLHAAETDAATLTVVRTEALYVEELIALDRLDLAQQHLELVRELAPSARNLQRYLEGSLALARRDWETAAKVLGDVSDVDFDDARRSHIFEGRFRANFQLGDLDRAWAAIALDKTDWPRQMDPETRRNLYLDQRPEWVAEAFEALGMAYLQRAFADPDNVDLRDRVTGTGLLEIYVDRLPEAQRAGWVQLQEANVLHDVYMARVAESVTPDAADRVPTALRPLALRVRGFYHRICLRYPDSAAAAVAAAHISRLDAVLQPAAAETEATDAAAVEVDEAAPPGQEGDVTTDVTGAADAP